MPTAPLPAPAPRLPRLLKVSEVAHRLSTCEKFVRGLIRQRELVGIRIGNRWRLDPTDLQTLIDSHRQAANVKPLRQVATAPLTAPLPVKLLEVHVVARRLSASQRVVWRLIGERKLAAIRLGVRWRVDAQDLQAFIEQRARDERRRDP